jgi:uncharacterized pyridoxal phosphate-containing UPF0001 family protein
MEIPSRLAAIRKRMESACHRSGRVTTDVTLVAVAKTRTPAEVVRAVEAGVSDLGENRVQEAEKKIPRSPRSRPARGPPMAPGGAPAKNKVKKAVALFDRIHSLDSVELGHKIDRAAEEIGKVQPVLVQVDLASEPTKFGLPETDPSYAREPDRTRRLRVDG